LDTRRASLSQAASFSPKKSSARPMMIGQVKTSAECEQILNDWFDPYVSGSSSSNELQARFPLQGARVRISESTTDAARFHCEVVVRPQFQIDNVLGDITLRTDFGAGLAGKAA
jgi:type VI secretion system protein ImpD